MSNRKVFARATAALVALFVLPALVAQNTINVPADQPTIQAGIQAADNGDTVLVAPGTYLENIDFLGKSITVASSGGTSVTAIDGGHAGSVVTFKSGEGASAVLKGFTLQNGSAQFNGGGILVSSASPTITGNTIQNNVACSGGGGISSSSGSPVIQGNTIQNNTQTTGCSGGGGGGIEIGGAGFAKVTGNTIVNNEWPSGDGGGIELNAAGSPTISNNVISGNIATGVSPASQGGGIAMFNDSDALIVENLISNNSAGEGGGIAFLVPSGSRGPVLINNTMVGDSAPQGSEVFADGFDNQVQFFNNLMIGPSGQNAVFCGSFASESPTFTTNDAFSPNGTGLAGTCAGQSAQNGNISTDPLFVNQAAGDFHLQSTSPAIDAGTNSVANLPQTDFAGNPRILDGNNDCVSTVDIGAYELVLAAKPAFGVSSLGFANQQIGTSSAPQAVTLANTGTTCFQFSGAQITGDFSQTNSCAAAGVPAGSSCSYSVTFTPITSGTRTGTLTVTGTDGVTTTSPSVSLSGTGLTPPNVSLSTASLAFGPQPVSTSSSAQVVTLTNTGQEPLNITAISAGAPFSQTNNCPTSLAGGTACSISVTFAAGVVGTQTGTLSISDNAAGSPQTVALSGTAVDFSVSVSPASETVRRGNSAAVTVTVNPLGGPFNPGVALSCSGLPNFANCTFSPSLVTPGAGGAQSALTISTSGRTPRGTFAVSVVGQSGSLQHSATFTLTVR
jgi:hypothetical protein